MVPTGCFSGRETPHNGALGSRGNPWPDWTCECVLIHVILTCYLYHHFTMHSSRQNKGSKGMWTLGTRICIYCHIFKIPNVMLLFSQIVRFEENDIYIPPFGFCYSFSFLSLILPFCVDHWARTGLQAQAHLRLRQTVSRQVNSLNLVHLDSLFPLHFF